MATLQIHQIPCLQDNYGYLIHDPASGLTASVDTPDAAAIERALTEHGWKLDYILNTHHHFDHAGGNLALKAKSGCVVVGSRADAARIPGIDVLVGEGDRFSLGAHEARILETSGHTVGHICYVFDHDKAAFVGDTRKQQQVVRAEFHRHSLSLRRNNVIQSNVFRIDFGTTKVCASVPPDRPPPGAPS